MLPSSDQTTATRDGPLVKRWPVDLCCQLSLQDLQALHNINTQPQSTDSYKWGVDMKQSVFMDSLVVLPEAAIFLPWLGVFGKFTPCQLGNLEYILGSLRDINFFQTLRPNFILYFLKPKILSLEKSLS